VFIQQQQEAYPVTILCTVLQVTRSGFYRYVQQHKSLKPSMEALWIAEIKALHIRSRGSYGSRQMAKNMQAKGYPIGRYAARTLMRRAGVECKQRRRYKVTTLSQHKQPVAENLLNRAFHVAAPNHVWVADITSLWTQEGWLYIAAVLDLFSRRVVGWAVAAHMQETLVSAALSMALGRRQPSAGLLHHSDRGSQYTSHPYQACLKKAGIRVSMSRKGNCWDNSVMERFFGSLKSERTDDQRYETREEAKRDVIDYIEMFYNSQRLHSTLGYITPLQFEENNRCLFN
jgi:putative transposase